MSSVKKVSGTRLNKSLAIRDYKKLNPTSQPKEIASALAAKGMVVSAQFVSTVLSNAKKSGGVVKKRGPVPKAERRPLATAATVLPGFREIDQVRQICDAVNQIAGIVGREHVVEAVNEVNKLREVFAK